MRYSDTSENENCLFLSFLYLEESYGKFSIPLDRPSCSSLTCNICERLEDNVDYRTTHPVYQTTCVLCNQIYCGESSRPLNERLNEHWQFATNPDKPSYREKALAVHYREHQHNIKPNLKFKLLYSVRNTVKYYEEDSRGICHK